LVGVTLGQLILKLTLPADVFLTLLLAAPVTMKGKLKDILVTTVVTEQAVTLRRNILSDKRYTEEIM
jgi:hypothetical protein